LSQAFAEYGTATRSPLAVFMLSSRYLVTRLPWTPQRVLPLWKVRRNKVCETKTDRFNNFPLIAHGGCAATWRSHQESYRLLMFFEGKKGTTPSQYWLP